MGSPIQIKDTRDTGDSWSRINPESVPPPTLEPDVPMTHWEKVFYCLITPRIYWWISGMSPSSTKLGAVERFLFFFNLGLPPRGFLGFWEFTLYLSIILGLPAAVFVVAIGLLDLTFGAILAVVFFLWAVILYKVYFDRLQW